MRTSILLFIFLLMGWVDSKAQVIYERTYPKTAIYIQKLFELSDNSTVSFSIDGVCPFAEWLRIDADGNPMGQAGLGNESAHSLDARWIGADSILVSYRIGPLDFDGPNTFNVKLWTPTEITTLVEDTVSYRFWEDFDVNYGAYLFQNNKIIYQKEDTLYQKDIITGQIEEEVIQPYLFSSDIFPVRDHLLVFSFPEPAILYDHNLQPVFTWSISAVPGGDPVSIDSFFVGISTPGYQSLHIINAFDESFRDIDLSAYFTLITSLSVNKNVLMVQGISGSQSIVVQLDAQLKILAQYHLDIPQPIGINEMMYTYFPDRVYAWSANGLSNYGANYRICYQYPDADPIQYIDVALDSVWVDSTFHWSPDPHSPYIVYLLCRVKNFSLEPIENFTIHIEEPPFGMCDPGVYPSLYEGLHIMPGETDTVLYQAISFELSMGEPFIRTFYVEHGNHHLDSFTSNNIYTVIYLASDIKEPVQEPIIVLPNPFRDHISTTLQADRVDLALFNQMGRLVSTGIDQLDQLSELPVGIYFLQIHDGQRVLVRKVVKVE